MKRQLYVWHRWLGIVSCLFMVLWFVSGVVMLYVGYPKLTPAEHLSHLPELPEACCEELPRQWAQTPLESLRLTTLAGKPHYVLRSSDGQPVAVDAQTGAQVNDVDSALAMSNAWQYNNHAVLHYRELLDEDMWTHSRALDAHRPLHVVTSNDEADTWLYVSSRTGEVVLDANAQERAWNWLGAWLHWLYPLRGGFGFDNGWRVLVIGLSLIGTVMAVLGMCVGLLRMRWRTPYRHGSRSPYKESWLRWHHIAGLIFGTLLVLWVFSGLMSMRPWGLTDDSSQLSPKHLQQGPLRAADLPFSVNHALSQLHDADFHPVELEWRRLAGETYLVARDSKGASWILEDGEAPKLAFSRERLLAAARPLAEGISLRSNWQSQYDFYYFARAEHSMNGAQKRPLPVLRMTFGDAAKTWLYMDPTSGEVVALSDQSQRNNRWLFNLLHSWDMQALLQHPWLRESLVILFSLGGLLISVSGVVLGWRRLRPAKAQLAGRKQRTDNP
ncbi:PepSY domain-containing protein [Ectopseudomonas mendocina]|uniref:PepSY domain-containing protein n=1 Tax=Ectopseudomonas mendocina TaxID=300 RepID=A0ABZ2RQT7_ECTME